MPSLTQRLNRAHKQFARGFRIGSYRLATFPAPSAHSKNAGRDRTEPLRFWRLFKTVEKKSIASQQCRRPGKMLYSFGRLVNATLVVGATGCGRFDLPPQQTMTGSSSIDFSIIGAVAAALGLHGALRGPYRPDLGDTFFRSSRRSGFPWLPVTPPTGPRSWWTGEPRS
jgi:hypothetical protein